MALGDPTSDLSWLMAVKPTVNNTINANANNMNANNTTLSGSTLPCGCYSGPWWGVTPPPRCAQHSTTFTPPIVPLGPFDPSSPPFLPQILPQTPGTLDLTEWTRILSGGSTATPLQTELRLNELEKFVLLEAEKAMTANEHAAHDVWQMVLEQLGLLRQLIIKARAVKTIEPTK